LIRNKGTQTQKEPASKTPTDGPRQPPPLLGFGQSITSAWKKKRLFYIGEGIISGEEEGQYKKARSPSRASVLKLRAPAKDEMSPQGLRSGSITIPPLIPKTLGLPTKKYLIGKSALTGARASTKERQGKVS